MFALTDADSFYCSSERAFDPSLRTTPLVGREVHEGSCNTHTPAALCFKRFPSGYLAPIVFCIDLVLGRDPIIMFMPRRTPTLLRSIVGSVCDTPMTMLLGK